MQKVGLIDVAWGEVTARKNFPVVVSMVLVLGFRLRV